MVHILPGRPKGKPDQMSPIRAAAPLEYLAAQKCPQPPPLQSHKASARSSAGRTPTSGLRGDDPAALLPSIRQRVGTPRPIPDLLLTDTLHNAGEGEGLMIVLTATAGLRAIEISRVNIGDILGARLLLAARQREGAEDARRADLRRPCPRPW